MANSTTPLTGNTPLQIKIYTAAAARPENPSNVAGVISFDQVGQRVGINGQWYGADQTDFTALTSKVTGILNALTSEGLVTVSESGGTATYTYTPISVTGVDLAQGDNPTIANWLKALEAEISAVEAIASTAIQQVTVNGVTLTRGTATGTSNNVSGNIDASEIKLDKSDNSSQTVKAAIEGINTTISNMDATVGSTSVESGKHVAVQVVEADGIITGVTVTEDDIASAAALQTLDGAVVKSVNGVSPTAGATGAVTINGTQITVGGSGALNDSTVAAAINSLSTSITNIDKDSFVKSGTLVYGPADNIEGRYTAANKPSSISTTKTGTATDPYIELVIYQYDNDTTAEAYIYIKATSLVYDYTATNQTGAVSVSIDSNRNITASLVNAASHTEQNTALNAPTGTITSASTTDVYSQVSVTTEDGKVSGVSGSTKSVDAAGAAAAAESAAKTYAKDYADTICSWSVIDTTESGS